LSNQQWEESVSQAKPFEISKQVVLEAYKRVKANRGAAGVDEESIQDFEVNLKNNLYKIWNRMSSGCYFPPAVRRVEIPKESGGLRALGIPTVSDRIAQMVARIYLEPKVEPYFHEDSYGYRPNKSAIDALGVARKRCWRYNWVLDLDIRGFFDNLDHELLMRAVRKHTDCKWVLLYVERWLKASVQFEDGTLIKRDKGTPQGGVVSPLLANLFLHYALDEWMKKNYPNIPWERYADDAVFHCKTEAEANTLKTAIGERLGHCKLELHPEKTKIVYCKDERRQGDYPHTQFDFLGYTFRPRQSRNKWGKYFVSFSPAVSNKAATYMRRTMRKWRLHRRSEKSLSDIARMCNPILRGWINYYSKYHRSALYPIFQNLNRTLTKWVMWKYKLKGRRMAANGLGRIARLEPCLFAHWQISIRP
jgi:RNA-directed DNA polymerase